MANLKSKIRSLYCLDEGAFASDPDASGATYKYIHAIDASMSNPSYTIINGNYQNDKLVSSKDEVAEQKAHLSFKIPLRASGTPSANSTAAIAGELDIFLKLGIFGTVTRPQGKTISSGTTTTATVADTTSYTVGQMVYITGQSAMRYVTGTTSTVVTYAPATTGSASGVLISPSIYTPADTGHRSMSFVAKVDTTEYTLSGGKCDSAKIAGMTANGRPLLEVAFSFDSWAATTKASLPAADDAFSAVAPAILKGAPFWWNGAATHVSSLDIDFGFKFEFSPSTNGTSGNGRSGVEKVDGMPKGSFTPWWATSYLTDMAAGTTRVLAMGVGTQNNGWGIYIPVAQITGHEMHDVAGQLAQKVGFEAKDNGSSPEIVLSVF